MASTSTNGPMYKIDPAHHFQSIALQVWAYESIPTITECGVHKVSNDAIPRMLRWVCELSPKSHVLQRQVFDSPMFLINVVIEMMPEEEEHLRMSSGELVEKTHPYNTVSEKMVIQNDQEKLVMMTMTAKRRFSRMNVEA
ncbi:uncharacterized protein LOC116402454 [Cucumis sativus]|uniref:uncharacterized protein LOC116402454 n=1 Tax=Cucumis sativus TaxID=3659 RepID=UPI0012F5020E|nr:uncharacterized protein LOC116402454 [Cucumis sativus]